MPTRILLRLLLLAGLAAPLYALALGVGPLEVRSALNQNLEAEIPLIVNNPAELVGLTVQIPRQQEFDRVGIERLEFLSKLRFAVQTTPSGPNFIKVTSIQPIREPSFDLLVEVIWPRGRLLRTFPVHLDPELYANRRQPSPPPVETPLFAAPAVETPPVTTAPSTPSLPPAPPVSFEGASFYGPVKRGENLTRIANQIRPSTAISVPEMMAILVAGNPEAFTNGNPNTLRAGAVLRVPSAQALGLSGAPTPTPVPDVAAVTPIEPEASSPTLPASPPEAAVAPAPVEAPPVAPLPAEMASTAAESTPPMPIPPPQEIVPQTTIPQVEPQPVPAEGMPPPAATETLPPVAETPPPQPEPAPVAKPPAPLQETGMGWLSNPVVWIAIALIVLAVGSVLLLPLLRRPARPATRESSAPSADIEETGEVAARSETRTSVRRSEAKSKWPIPDATEETAAVRPTPTVKPVVKPVPKAVATPPPKPIDELLKDIDFNLGDERPRTATEGKEVSPVRGGEARRMPDAEPPTASVTRTPIPTPIPTPSSPQPVLEPLSELPSGLQLDKLDFDLGDLGLDSARKPVELPPLELKPATPSKSADWSALDLKLPDIEPSTRSEPATEPPKASDLKFEFTDVNQEQVRNREDLARLDEELQSFGGELDLGKMALSSPPGDDKAGADYVETQLDLAAAYLDMGDQVGARGLLEDVLQEGDTAQKKRAEDLLKKLG